MKDTGRRRKGTGRMVTSQGSRPHQEEKAAPPTQQREARPPQQQPSKTPLYVGIGVGAVALLIILGVAMSGGEEVKRKNTADRDLARALSKIATTQNSGDYRQALTLVEEALGDARFKRCARYKECTALANFLRPIVNAERDAVAKVADFRNKIAAAKADNTAMKKSKEFWDECNTLLASYRTTSSGAELLGIKEDLRRWVATEAQSDWQKDYNSVKDRIDKQFLTPGDFAQAAREWKQFAEVSQDPLFKSRIETELRAVDQAATHAAEQVVTDAGTGAGAREKLEGSMARFTGTAGQALINQKLKTLR